MFQGQDFRVQGLSREIEERPGAGVAATTWIIGAVANQRQPGMGSLNANLVFAAGFQPEPQFADEPVAASQGIFRNDFKVRDGFPGLACASTSSSS